MYLTPPDSAIRLSRQSAEGTNVCFFMGMFPSMMRHQVS
jgi:hypothetical protein